MSTEEDPTAREVYLLLKAHLATCANLSKINLGFMAAVFGAVVTFAGYTYTENRRSEEQRLVTAETALNAIHQTAQEAAGATVRQLAAKPSRIHSQDGDSQ